MTQGQTVLVTGGSGYIAGYCILQLVERGHRVRTTVRSLAREAGVRAALHLTGKRGAAVSFHEADLTRDAGWAEAVQGCDYVLHVASPIPPTLPRSEDELIVPAREGTLRVLRAAKAAGVRRVVVTSSTAAVTYGAERTGGRVFTEADWTDPTHPDTSPYIRSKTLAERAAWAFVEAEGGIELATVNPGAVLGPVLGDDFSASIEIVKKMLEGSLPGLPRLGFPLVDVRDIADLHLRAMTHPAAAGQRFLGAGPFLWFADIAQILHERLGAKARRVPRRGVPDFMIRLMARFDPITRSVVFELGKERRVSSQKAQDLLGWTMRPVEDSIVATAETLISRDVVRV